MEPVRQRFTLSKEERLHGKKDIAGLLAKGKFRTCKEFRYCYRPDNSLPYSRIMISVPKKLFRRAVWRNTLKRRIRESYRLQKNMIPEGRGADILFIYNSKKIAASKDIFASVGQILDEIRHEIGRN